MIASLWGSSMALRARTQQVGPLIQNGVFLAVFLSTAYTPIGLLDGWLGAFAKYNPVTYVLEMARQATVEGIPPSWEHTWPGLLALHRHDARLRPARPARAAPDGRLIRRGRRELASAARRLTVRFTSAVAVDERVALKRSS